MRSRLIPVFAAVCLSAAIAAVPAAASYPSQGNFGLNSFDVTFTNLDGTSALHDGAGSHPFAMTTRFGTNLDAEDKPEGWLRDVVIAQVRGLLGDTTAYPQCSSLQILNQIPDCSPETAVGIVGAPISEPGLWVTSPVYNLDPPPGVLVRLGFRVLVASVVIDVRLNDKPPYEPVGAVRNAPQLVSVYGNVLELWGNPSHPAHDEFRGKCAERNYGIILPPGEVTTFEFEGTGEKCEVEDNPKPFLTLPATCTEPLLTSYDALSWEGERDTGGVLTHGEAGAPEPFSGCGGLPSFDPSITAQPTSRAAESPTGLDFSLEIQDAGLTNVSGRAKSPIREVVATLPEGMTANPSLAEGLEVCSEADLDRETLASGPDAGCPQASKIGTIEVESPLVAEPVKGALYQAAPFDNLADDSLIAFYIVVKNPKLGIFVKQTVRVEPNPRTGQLVAITEDIPQLAFSAFRLKFREGGRSPLVSPPTCGTHEMKAVITPWSGQPSTEAVSRFEIVSGPNEGPCPSPGTQPFAPGFEAGSASNAAGAYTPFSMRLTRRDGDQDLTRFDATLPPGVLAKLAGVSKCPDAQIALAKAKTGKAELRSPSCPLNSRIGRVSGGAGVGSQLTYVPGTLYLAGPFAGAPLSVVAIVPAVAGPFDVGTVVVRQALSLDPVTGEVTADGARSEPLPHILAGIPLRVREIQVHVDRSSFTINPTSCEPMTTDAAIWGGGIDQFSLADNSPVSRSARFQAADCARLGFKPRLAMRLKGGTRRGDNPAFSAVLRGRPGDANIERTVVRLPRSAFLDQGHIRTICTRVQFAAERCPKGAIYGHVTAFSPLLDEPLKGPAYLRSSNNELPDLVFDLKGLVDIEAAARVDSIRGGIRVTFPAIPDAPVSKVVVRMQGGKKGLIVNSRNLCAGVNRAAVRLDAHSGKRALLRPALRPRCGQARR